MVGVGTFSRLLVAPSIGPEKNVAMSPSSTTVHEGQHDISRVAVSWLIRAGGNPPPHKYRLHYLHILASYSPPRAVNFKEGDMATFFLQDLGLALVTKTCPHRPQAIKRAKNGQAFP